MWAHDDLYLLMQVQDGMKAGLQELLSGERVGTVRRALAMAAAAIARIAVPANQWPALLPWLHGCTQSPCEAQRETALMLICSLIDTIGAHRSPPVPLTRFWCPLPCLNSRWKAQDSCIAYYRAHYQHW